MIYLNKSPLILGGDFLYLTFSFFCFKMTLHLDRCSNAGTEKSAKIVRPRIGRVTAEYIE